MSKTSQLASRFVLEYRRDLNATAAYRRIRPKVKDSTAATEGWKLLRNPEVQAQLSELTKTAADRLHLDAQRVLDELSIVGFSNVQDYVVSEAGALELAPGVPDFAARAVSTVKHRTITRGQGDTQQVERRVEYGLWNKPAALKMLGEHLGVINQGEGAGGNSITLKVQWDNE